MRDLEATVTHTMAGYHDELVSAEELDSSSPLSVLAANCILDLLLILKQ